MNVDNYTDLAKSIQPSKYYSEDVFMEKTDTNSYIIMSLNCQSLHAKHLQKMEHLFKCYVYKRHSLKTVTILIKVYIISIIIILSQKTAMPAPMVA